MKKTLFCLIAAVLLSLCAACVCGHEAKCTSKACCAKECACICCKEAKCGKQARCDKKCNCPCCKEAKASKKACCAAATCDKK